MKPKKKKYKNKSFAALTNSNLLYYVCSTSNQNSLN